MRNTCKAFLGTSKEMQGVDVWDMTKLSQMKGLEADT